MASELVALGERWLALPRNVPIALLLDTLGVFCENRERHFEGRRKSADSPPGWILPSTLEMRDPCRMQRGSMSEFFLAEPPLETQFPQRGAQAFLGFGSAGHRPHRPDNVRQSP
ncbi:MAG: hypothetical protein WKF96_05920 [Solirubrobacteraceae bacterium]